jgi:hypothetical protein
MLLKLIPILALAFAALSAQAEVRHAEAYESLTAVTLAPGHAPRTVNGVSELSAAESRHAEKLPLQLGGAIKKIQKSKYRPSGLSRDEPTGF